MVVVSLVVRSMCAELPELWIQQPIRPVHDPAMRGVFEQGNQRCPDQAPHPESEQPTSETQSQCSEKSERHVGRPSMDHPSAIHTRKERRRHVTNLLASGADNGHRRM